MPWRTSGAQAEHWHSVQGAALRELFKDKKFGEMSKRVSGSWRVAKDELCWKWQRPSGPDECYEVQQDGAHVRLLINRSEAWYGTLEPLR